MVNIAKTQIAPAVEAYTAEIAKAAAAKKTLDSSLACSFEIGLVKKLSTLTDMIAAGAEALGEAVVQLGNADDIGAEAVMIRDTVLTKMGELRVPCDEAETLTARSFWPFPTYADLLFGVK